MTTLTLRALAPSSEKPDIKRELKGFSLPAQSASAIRQIAPDSVDWHEMRISQRLSSAPALESMVRSGKAKVVYCEPATSSCEEKARAAGLHPDSIVKAMYTRDVFSDARFLIVVTGTRRIRFTGILSDVYEGASLELADRTPSGMHHGTCTPFLPDETAKDVAYIAVESPSRERKDRKGRVLGKLGDVEADISIGGTDQTAHHLSLRMRYSDLVDTLLALYPSKAVIVSDIERM